MHKKNIELLRDESQRLISLELDILGKMLEEPGILSESQTGQVQTFDRTTAPKHIEMLKGEQIKLERLEMVLAVVGTMKAGKSTTINAIVGTEVLPNRNRPMTALPTLIEHTPGQLEPLLEFNNSKPIEILMSELQGVIKLHKNEKLISDLRSDKDMKELLDLIEVKAKLKTKYQGSDSIFYFLKTLNDLVRLSKELDVDFPFSEYDEINEIPKIKIEFIHLRGTDQKNGKLTLLDTPGPNESGQPHLKKMLTEQLAKASGVLAVLDFSQLKSEADAQVRENLKDIVRVTEGRLYTLVNKFDQKDRNGDTEEQVKTYVANILMERAINEDAVFPVSSQLAYLANRAKNELFINKKLPDHTKQPWVADFGKAAFGAGWLRKITDVETIEENANALWEDSLFNVPLNKVIKSAHARAAIFAVDSASAKLVDMAERLENFLNIRETALMTSTRILRDQIEKLQQDISRIEATESDAKKQVNKTLLNLEKGTKSVFEKVKKNVVESSENYLKDGKRIEEALYKKERESIKKQDKKSIIGFFMSLLSSNNSSNLNSEADFDSSSQVLKFTDKNSAEQIISRITKSISDIIDHGEFIMKNAMNLALEEFESDFSKNVIPESQKIINEMKHRMKESGFSINLKIPNASSLKINKSGSDILDDLISEKSSLKTKSRRKSGVWGGICSFFGTSDWGWEDYQVREDYFEIDIQIIKLSVIESVNKIFEGLDKDVIEKIRTPLESNVKVFFDSLKKTVEQIRGDLLQGIRDQESSKVEQEALTKRIAALKKNIPTILSDSSELQKDARQHLSSDFEVAV